MHKDLTNEEGQIVPFQGKVIIPALLHVVRKSDNTTKLVFHWRNIIALTLSLMLMAWIGLFSAAFFHLKYRRGYDQASYLKTLALPFIWEDFNKERGNFYIEEGFKAVEEGEILSALNRFRAGLVRVPEHSAARLELAEIYEYTFERPLLAVNLLEDGLPYLNTTPEADRKEYLQLAVFCASRNRLDRELIEIVEYYESHYGLNSNEQWDLRLAYLLATSYRNIDDLDKSKSLIDRYDLNRTSSGLVLTAQLMWDKGEHEEAFQLLTNSLSNYEEKSFIFDKILVFCREKGLTNSERLFCNLYRTTLPDNYLATINYLTYYYENEPTERTTIIDRTEAFIDQFIKNQIALKHIANLAAKYGDTSNVEKIFERYKEAGHSIDEFLIRFTLIESKVRSGNFKEALQDLEQAEMDRTEPFDLDQQSIIHSIKAAAYFGLDNKAYLRMELDQLLESPYYKLARYFSISDFFLSVNAPELSLEVMERCMETRASNPHVTQSFVAIHLQSNDADELSEKAKIAMQERRLPSHLLKQSYLKLASDQNVFVQGREEVLNKIETEFEGDYLFRKQEAI